MTGTEVVRIQRYVPAANNIYDADIHTQGQMPVTEPNYGSRSSSSEHSRTTSNRKVSTAPEPDVLNHGNGSGWDSNNIVPEVKNVPDANCLNRGNEYFKDSNIIPEVKNTPDANPLNHENENCRDLNLISEVNHQEDDDAVKPTEKPGSFSFSSSSASSSSSCSSLNEDIHQPDKMNEEATVVSPELDRDDPGSHSHKSCSSLDEDIHQSDKMNEEATVVSPKLDRDDPCSHSHKSESCGLCSPGLASPPDASSYIPQLMSLHSTSGNQSPPLQVMQRAQEPSPYRIPSTVFARSPSASPVEWSVTSNESLFSIHMGNNSFSGDQIFLMGRSEELGIPGDYSNFLDTPPKPMEPKSTPTYSTAAAAASSHQKSFDMRTSIGVAEAAAETMKDVIRVTAEDQDKAHMPPSEAVRHSSSYSRRSDESGTSVVSFAFPILTGDGGRTVSAKVDPEPQHVRMGEEQEQQNDNGEQPPPSSPAPPSAPNQKKWFPCFTCCSSCC